MPNPNTINPMTKLCHLCIFGRTQRKQPRENPLQRTTNQPIVFPERDLSSIANFPLESVFKIPSPAL